MRVVHVTTSDASLRYLLLDQMRYLRDSGHEVVAMSSDGPHVETVRTAGIPVHTVPLRRWIDPIADARGATALVRGFRRLRPDIVHTHTPKAGLLGQWAALLAGVQRRVHTIHGLYLPGHMRPEHRWRYLLLERLQMTPSHLLLSQNSEDLETCRRERLCDPSRLRFLGNGIDVMRFSPSRVDTARIAAIRTALGIPPSDAVVGMVGRLVAEKGYLEYFAAAARVLGEAPNTTFLAIGQPEPWKPGADSVTPQRAIDIGLGERMRFLGQREDMPDLYAAMDVLVLPSHREGFPRAPMEASAMGIPVVASDVRGCREAVINEENGILVPARDSAALARAILRLLRDPQLRRRLGALGYAMAQERFDQRLVFARVAAAYRELAGAV